MSSPADSYANAILSKFHRYATWPPNGKLRLGDIGILEDKLFHYRSNLETIGIHFECVIRAPITLSHSSESTIALNARVAGQAMAVGAVDTEARFDLSFASSGAFVFQAVKCREHEITDKLTLANELKRLCHDGRWNREWVVIESLYEVESAVIIVSNSNNAKVGISVKADFPLAGIAPLANANAQGALAVTSQSGDSTVVISEQKLTPLLGLLHVRPSIFERIRDLFTPVAKEDEVLEWLQSGTPQAEN